MSRDRGLIAIGAFKLVKAVLLIGVGFGLLQAFHVGKATALEQWIELLRIDPNNLALHWVAKRVLGLNRRHLEILGVGTFVYAAVFATEGVGLLLAKPWAEYLTFGVTVSFIPIEVYELARHASVMKALAIAVNVAIAIYLLLKLRALARPARLAYKAPSRRTR